LPQLKNKGGSVLAAPVIVLDRMESWKEAFAHRPDLLQFKTELEKKYRERSLNCTAAGATS
jgi:hypothetical protein